MDNFVTSPNLMPEQFIACQQFLYCKVSFQWSFYILMNDDDEAYIQIVYEDVDWLVDIELLIDLILDSNCFFCEK
jgi:hypothetical protein